MFNFSEVKAARWVKRGFNLRRCTWKGFEHFESKVLWSVIAYNIRVMTGHIVKLV